MGVQGSRRWESGEGSGGKEVGVRGRGGSWREGGGSGGRKVGVRGRKVEVGHRWEVGVGGGGLGEVGVRGGRW